MKKKFYSLLALPLVGIMCLFGCGKVDRTVKEIETLWSDTVVAYDSPQVEGMKNWYFGTANMEGTSTDGEQDNYQTFVVKYANTELSNAVTTTVEPTTTLQQRYNQLRTVYAKTLKMAFNYYSNWKDVFFGGIEAKEPAAEDLTELYDRMKDFQRELESFHTLQLNLEREIELFGVNSEIIASSVDTFNYSYNKLIDKTLNFVNYFKDLHVKYFYGSNPAIDSSYAKRVYDEAMLQLANYIYLDYLQAFEKNATVKMVNMYGVDNVFNIFAYSDDKNLYTNKSSQTVTLIDHLSGGNYNRTSQLDSKFAAELMNTAEGNKKDKCKAEVEKFVVALDTFNQHFSLYKKVYAKVNMEKFNTECRFTVDGSDNEAEYLENLSVVDAANARVLINFEKTNIYSFMIAMNNYRSVAANFGANGNI